MKKVTSAALLGLKLTWKTALALYLCTAGLLTFSVWRWLMPGGVPLQTTFGFETMLRSVVEFHGKWWFVMLLLLLPPNAAFTKGSKTTYTMNRLGLSENQMTLVFGGVFTGYFLLYWALQLALAYGFFVWYAQFSLVSSNAWMLACWRSEWLHILLPLGEWWGYLRNVIICLSFGFCAALRSQLVRRGKAGLGCMVPPLLCAFILNGRVGSAYQNSALMVLLVLFTIGYDFAVRGGREDEDL